MTDQFKHYWSLPDVEKKDIRDKGVIVLRGGAGYYLSLLPTAVFTVFTLRYPFYLFATRSPQK